METQVQQLRLNVKNIRSVLVKSNRELYGIGKKRNVVRKRVLNRSKQIEKEENLEKKLKPKTVNTSSAKKSVESSSNPLDTLLNAGLIIGGGVLINALPGLLKMFEDFKKEHKPIFDTIGSTFTAIYNGVSGIVNSILGPESEEGFLDGFAKFGDDGELLPAPEGGALSELKKVIEDLVPIVEKINDATKNPIVKSLEKSGFIRERSLTDRVTEFVTGAGPGGSNTSVKTEDDQGRGTGPTDSAHGSGGGNHQSSVGFVPGKGNKQKGIFLHWSAGSHTTPYSAYHSIALGDGTMVRNTPYDQDKYSHTGGANTNSVGLAIAAAAGAQERGKLGQYAPTDAQLNAMTLEAAKLAIKWGWSEGTIDKNVRTHGEWERYATRNGILSGSPQRWDLDRLKDGDPLIDASKVLSYGGNQLREMIKQHFRNLKIQERTQQRKASIRPVNTNTANKLASTGPVEGSRDVAVVLMGEQ